MTWERLTRPSSNVEGRKLSTSLSLIVQKKGSPSPAWFTRCFLYWAADVARVQHLPAALLWIQPATVFDIYYYYFNGYGDIFNNCKDISYVIELPGLPPLTSRDIPSFTLPSNTYTVAIQAFQEQLEHLSQETNPKSACQLFRCIGIGTHECH
ncbi:GLYCOSYLTRANSFERASE [Salix purpurea]|uniref:GLYCOSYLTRANSFERASE n=1 Tax=Salix purpurea TaxID=77065 RepID=A0A9Q0SR21_SALPP|nr:GLYCOSYLTRANSFERASE [Salix purpurea]